MGGQELFDLVSDDHPSQALIGHAAGDADRRYVLYAFFDHAGDDLFSGYLAVPVAKQNSLSVLNGRYGLIQFYYFVFQLTSTFRYRIFKPYRF